MSINDEPLEAETVSRGMATVGNTAVSLPEAGGMLDLFRLSIEKGQIPDFKTLYDLHAMERDRANRIAFNNALAKFQSEIEPIVRDKTVDYVSKSGGRVFYRSASFEAIMEAIREPLHRHGFTAVFDTAISQGGMMRVSLTLTHVESHKEQSHFELPTVNNNPGMSEQQKFAGAATFGRRQCLISLLGLALTDPEPEDGTPHDPRTITDEQAANIQAMIDETGTDKAKFLRWVGAATVEDIRATEFARVIAALERKRGGQS